VYQDLGVAYFDVSRRERIQHLEQECDHSAVGVLRLGFVAPLAGQRDTIGEPLALMVETLADSGVRQQRIDSSSAALNRLPHRSDAQAHDAAIV